MVWPVQLFPLQLYLWQHCCAAWEPLAFGYETEDFNVGICGHLWPSLLVTEEKGKEDLEEDKEKLKRRKVDRIGFLASLSILVS